MSNAVAVSQHSESVKKRIQVLSEEVVTKIAAGEIIERPASVVRELLDNALDAGGDEITVAVEEGGRRLIRVIDNGQGMEREEVILAFQNHATSKIRSVEDLFSITTFGFRGEALASIASISRVEVKTRTHGAELGTRLIIEGGRIISVEAVSCGKGTEITVRNLFFNTPARRKFLKTGATEEAKIKQWLIQSALPNISVNYRLLFDGREVLRLNSASSINERARQFVKGSIETFSGGKGEIKVSGIIGHPGSSSSSATNLVILVNKRVVKDALLLKAVREGFSSMLKGYEIPVGVISVELPPSQVDINVHPQKSEVRFVASGEAFVAVRDTVLSVIKTLSSPINVELNSGSQILESSSYYSRSTFKTPEHFSPKYESSSVSIFDYTEKNQKLEPIDFKPESERKISFRYRDLRFVGQIFECYLICEHNNTLVVIDMHAAHERVNYNIIRKAYKNKGVSSQGLTIPVVVQLSPVEKNQVLEAVEVLRKFGFDIESFGEHEVVVRSAPTFVSPKLIPKLISEIASEHASTLSSSVIEEHVDRVAARIACHGSIRSGKIMKSQEVSALLDALDEAEIAGACPHGRPVIVSFAAQEVERWFGRDR